MVVIIPLVIEGVDGLGCLILNESGKYGEVGDSLGEGVW